MWRRSWKLTPGRPALASAGRRTPVAEVAIPHWRACRAGEHERVGKAGGKGRDVTNQSRLDHGCDDNRAPARRAEQVTASRWPDRSWPAGQGTGQGLTRTRRPGPERDPETSASPPMTGGARPRSLPGRKRNRTRTAPWPGGPNLNGPGGKLTGLVVTRPGDPEEKEKCHESHRRGAERQCDHRQRL